jgi:hypothetical protein
MATRAIAWASSRCRCRAAVSAGWPRAASSAAMRALTCCWAATTLPSAGSSTAGVAAGLPVQEKVPPRGGCHGGSGRPVRAQRPGRRGWPGRIRWWRPAAAGAGVGEQDLAAGTGERPRDPPGEHSPAVVGGQAARAVAGAGQLPPPARGAPHAGRGGHLGQPGVLVAGQGNAGQRRGGDPGGGAERGQVRLVQLVQPRLAGALVAVDAAPVDPGEDEDGRSPPASPRVTRR